MIHLHPVLSQLLSARASGYNLRTELATVRIMADIL